MQSINVAFLVLLLLTSCDSGTSAERTEGADLVLHQGIIYTVNADQPWAEAVAIVDGALVFVGTNANAAAWINDNTEVIDLNGRLVLPGLHDVHAHPLEAGSPVAGTCVLSDGDPEAMIAIIQACAPHQIGTDWVLGWGHFIGDLLEADRSPRAILDEAVPNRPAIMMEQTSHSVWVNSLALEQAGITATTPDPPGGVILKDPDTGEPDGILLDNAGNLLMDHALAPTAELADLHYEGLLYGLEQLAQHGITSVADARTYWGRNYHRVWQRAEAENTLTARAVLGLWAYPHQSDEQLTTLRALYANHPDKLVKLSQIKVYVDGIVTNTTAAVHEPYQLDLEFTPDNRGLNYFDQARLTHFITELGAVDFDFHIHAIGDRGVHEALNAIEAATQANGTTATHRHRLTHLELIAPADFDRFRALGVLADFQVAGDFTLPAHFPEAEPFIGDRAYRTIPLRSLHDAGAHITLSSDWDVSDLSPFVGMQHALTRGQESLPDLETVIRAYTLNGAYALRQEDLVGSLEVGKLADLVVLDQNLFNIPIDQIATTQVLLTMLEGETVYRASNF